jgi:cytochrome c biogenesis protein CcmG/thiol:disulfide interchange protein DsbE
MSSPESIDPPTEAPTARRRPVPVAVVTLAVLLVALLTFGLLSSGASTTLDSAVKRGERPTAPASTIALPRLGARGTTRIADLRGRIAIVNIWASWCPPCEDEAPILASAHRALMDAGEGQVLGVTHVDPSAKSLAKVHEWQLPYPSVRDVNDAVYDAYGATAPPETYVLDERGRVVAIARGTVTTKFLNAALAEAGATARIDPSVRPASER